MCIILILTATFGGTGGHFGAFANVLSLMCTYLIINCMQMYTGGLSHADLRVQDGR